LRNETKPEGVYFGFVSEDRFDEVTRYFTPPSDRENFHVIYYEPTPHRQRDRRVAKFQGSVPQPALCTIQEFRKWG
jgi:hypothetical protein